MVRGGKFLVLLISILLLLLTLNIVLAIDTASSDSGDSTSTTDTQVTRTSVQDTTQNSDATSKASEWLSNATANQAGIFDQSLAVIAMVSAGRNDVSKYIQNLKAAQDTTGCWPKLKCTVKETAIASLAMSVTGQTDDAKKGADWLKAAKVVNTGIGDWWIVIKAPNGVGKCDVTSQASKQPKSYTIENDQIKEAAGKYYINLAEINTQLPKILMPTINVACTDNSIVALIYKPDPNKYFIQTSQSASNVDLKLANACFGITKGSRCDYESTAYASWALIEMGETGQTLDDLGTVIYLQSKARDNNVKELSLLNRILYKSGSLAPSFVQNLAKLQRPDGSWGASTFDTALATFALSGDSDQTDTVNRAIQYLEKKQDKTDGSWNQNVQDTSMAIIALQAPDLHSTNIASNSGRATPGATEDCATGTGTNDQGIGACADSDCLIVLEGLCHNGIKDNCEEGIDCGGACSSCEQIPNTPDVSECQTDTECSAGETCSNGQCVTSSTQTSSTPLPPPQQPSSGFPWFLVIIIVIILLLGVFYFKYVRTGKVDLKSLFRKKQKTTSFDEFKRQAEFRQAPQRPVQQTNRPQPRPPIRPQVKPQIKSKEEDELEKSIKEAQKLMKGS